MERTPRYSSKDTILVEYVPLRHVLLKIVLGNSPQGVCYNKCDKVCAMVPLYMVCPLLIATTEVSQGGGRPKLAD